MRATRFLRPAKWRNALRRRWFEYRLARTVELLRHPSVEHLGSAYGGWLMPVDSVRDGAIVYSIGVGGDTTFDEELIERFGCEIWAFDPSDLARDHATTLPEHLLRRFHFEQVGLWNADGSVRMYRAEHGHHGALSGANLQSSARWIEVPVRSLPSLMRERGHGRIDILKVDVEGSEYDILDPAVIAASRATIFAVELHHTGSVSEAHAFIACLARHGYLPIARKLTNFTFVRR